MSVKEWVWVVIKLRFRTFSAWLDTICIGRQICKKNFCLSHSMVCHFFSIWHGREGGWSKKLQSVTWVKGGGGEGGFKKIAILWMTCFLNSHWLLKDFGQFFLLVCYLLNMINKYLAWLVLNVIFAMRWKSLLISKIKIEFGVCKWNIIALHGGSTSYNIFSNNWFLVWISSI